MSGRQTQVNFAGASSGSASSRHNTFQPSLCHHKKMLSKLFTNDIGRFPIRAGSGNQYVMIAFHADSNLILQQAFKSKSDRHRIAAYNTIMTRLAARGLSIDLQILDNKASSAYKETIPFKWNATFHLVPPDMHCRNLAERAIHMFKDNFLAFPASVDVAFLPYLWDLLLPQAELALNLLRQATLNPWISAWELFQGLFDFNKMPLGPVGCPVLIHAKPASCRSWDFCACHRPLGVPGKRRRTNKCCVICSLKVN
jgi:hypothetical protein